MRLGWLRRIFQFAEGKSGVSLGHAIGLPPEQAIAYFRDKGMRFSFDWHEVHQEAHAKAFTVAKAMRADVLQDLHQAVDQSLKKGLTPSLRRDVEAQLKAKGWWGRQKVKSPSGEEREVLLGSPRRLETIFKTNQRTALSAGRWKEQLATADEAPYLQYVAVLDAKTRASHRALDGKVFRIDDPIWTTWYPPNDWGCRCRVRQLSREDVEARGLKVESSAGQLGKADAVLSEATGEVVEVSTYTNPDTGERSTTGAGWSYNPGLAAAADLVAYEKSKTWRGELRTAFWEDMQSQVLAERREAALGPLVDRVVAAGKARGEAAVVGWMAEADVVFLREAAGVEVESPVLLLNDKGILHMLRDSKGPAAFTAAELKKLPSLLARPEAVLWDTEDPALLYVRDLGGAAGKAVVRVNYKLKGQNERVNLVVTTGKVRKGDLGERYMKVRGKV